MSLQGDKLRIKSLAGERTNAIDQMLAAYREEIVTTLQADSQEEPDDWAWSPFSEYPPPRSRDPKEWPKTIPAYYLVSDSKRIENHWSDEIPEWATHYQRDGEWEVIPGHWQR